MMAPPMVPMGPPPSNPEEAVGRFVMGLLATPPQQPGFRTGGCGLAKKVSDGHQGVTGGAMPARREAGAPPAAKKKPWTVDSGASFPMRDAGEVQRREDLKDSEEYQLAPQDTALLKMAQGSLVADRAVDREIGPFGKQSLLNIEDGQNIIPMGKTVKFQRKGFHWDPDDYENPYFEDKETGEKTFLRVEEDIPVYDEVIRPQELGPGSMHERMRAALVSKITQLVQRRCGLATPASGSTEPQVPLSEDPEFVGLFHDCDGGAPGLDPLPEEEPEKKAPKARPAPDPKKTPKRRGPRKPDVPATPDDDEDGDGDDEEDDGPTVKVEHVSSSDSEDRKKKRANKQEKRERRIARKIANQKLKDIHKLTHLPANPEECDGCDVCKMRRSPAVAVDKEKKAEDEGADAPREWGDLLSADTIGPSPPALGGETSAMTQLDKATGYPCAEGMGEVSGESVTTAFTDMDRGNMHRIRRLRTDNASYFLSQTFRALLAKNDIKPEHPPPNRPTSNSGTERFHQTAEGGTRAQLASSRLAYGFWLLSLLHWLFNYSRLPSRTTDMMCSAYVPAEEYVGTGITSVAMYARHYENMDPYGEINDCYYDDEQCDRDMKFAQYISSAGMRYDEQNADFSYCYQPDASELSVQFPSVDPFHYDRFGNVTMYTNAHSAMIAAGKALSGAADSEEIPEGYEALGRAPVSPWERRYKKKYNGVRLFPFGCRATFLHVSDDHRGSLPGHRKWDATGRKGVCVGYGPSKSFLIMDLETYLNTGDTIFRVTRDVRIFPGVYELPSIDRGVLMNNLSAVSSVFRKQREAARQFLESDQATMDKAFDRGDGKCSVCAKWIGHGKPITCPPCNGKKGNHRSNVTCRRGRCQGHTAPPPGWAPVTTSSTVAPAPGPPPHPPPGPAVYPNLPPAPAPDVWYDAVEGAAPRPTFLPPTQNITNVPPAGSAPEQGAMQRTLQRLGESVGRAVGSSMGPSGSMQGALGEGVGATVGEAVGAVTGNVVQRTSSALTPTVGGSSGSGGGDAPAPGASAAANVTSIEGTLRELLRQRVNATVREHSNIAFVARAKDGYDHQLLTKLGTHVDLLGRNEAEEAEWSTLIEDVYLLKKKRGTRHHPRGYALVTRPINRSSAEFTALPAQKALKKDIDSLLDKQTFSWDYVEEAYEVRRRDPAAQFVRLHPILVVKNVELPEELQIVKARVVAAGNQILDSTGKKADPDASIGYVLPPGLGGVRLVFVYGHSMPGGGVILADVDTAYVQASLRGPRMWARSDPILRPPWMKSYRDPVVPLWGALYGIPRAGFDWDQHAEYTLVCLGWVKIQDGEGTTFAKGFLLLCLYVDDLVLGGPIEQARIELARIAERITLKVNDSELQRVVGMCFYLHWGPSGDKRVLLNMTQCVDALIKEFKSVAGMSDSSKFRRELCPEYHEGFTGLRRYEGAPGKLADISRRFIGKILYLCRAARPDAMHAVCAIAREVTRWTVASDMKLFRIVAYLETTRDASLEWHFGYGASPDTLHLYAQVDADHAGGEISCKSTGGELLWLCGTDANGNATMWALVEWHCRRQGQFSSSTAESELCAAHGMITKTLLPTASVLEQLLHRDIPMQVDMDNDAARAAMLKGVSPALRYVRKHRRVSVAATHSLLESCGIIVGRVETAPNVSDVLTKGLKHEEHTRHFYGCGLVFLPHRL